MMDLDNLEHHLEDPADAVTSLPSYDNDPKLAVSISTSNSNDEDDSFVEPRREHVHYDDDCALWIGNVDLRTSPSILFQLFSQVGEIRSVSFPNKQGRVYKGEERVSRFCFINFVVPDSVPEAIQLMQGTVLFGRELLLKCRRGPSHALNSTQQRHQSSKCMPLPEPSQLKGPPRANEETSSKWAKKTGADSTSDARSFSPIRAPVSNPESSVNFRPSSSSSSGRRKVELLRNNYADSPGRDERNDDSHQQPQPPQFHGAMMRSCRPHNMQFPPHQLQPRYYYDSAGMRPVYPHYNKDFLFNGGPRHPSNFPRFQHFPPAPNRPYSHSHGYVHPNNFRQPNMGYQAAPFRPRFDSYSYRPRYYNNCQQHYDNAPQSNHIAPKLFHNYLSSDNRDREMQQKSPDPPVPRRVRSRSRTRSRSQSPPLRNYCWEDGSVDQSQSGSGRKRRRSTTPSSFIEGRSEHKRRSVSRGSSSSYRSSYSTQKQRSVERHRGRKRARRSHSKSCASSDDDDDQMAGTSGLARPPTVLSTRRSTSPSDSSEYSYHGQKKSSGESSFSEEENDDKNDNTTVSSSNLITAKKKLSIFEKKVDSVNNSQESAKQRESRRSRCLRSPAYSYGTEREYDPFNPGY